MTRQLPADPPREDISPEEREEMIPVEKKSPKNRKIAFTLATFGGFLGLHRFYTGRPWSGLAMALTVGGLLIWWVVDFFVLLSGRFKDGQNRVLGRPLAVPREEVDQLSPEVREQLPDDEVGVAEPHELPEDPLEEEFEKLEDEIEGGDRKGRDGSV